MRMPDIMGLILLCVNCNLIPLEMLPHFTIFSISYRYKSKQLWFMQAFKSPLLLSGDIFLSENCHLEIYSHQVWGPLMDFLEILQFWACVEISKRLVWPVFKVIFTLLIEAFYLKCHAIYDKIVYWTFSTELFSEYKEIFLNWIDLFLDPSSCIWSQ